MESVTVYHNLDKINFDVPLGDWKKINFCSFVDILIVDRNITATTCRIPDRDAWDRPNSAIVEEFCHISQVFWGIRRISIYLNIDCDSPCFVLFSKHYQKHWSWCEAQSSIMCIRQPRRSFLDKPIRVNQSASKLFIVDDHKFTKNTNQNALMPRPFDNQTWIPKIRQLAL